jgi:hypothetical protein
MTMSSLTQSATGSIVYRVARPTRRLNPIQQLQRFLRRRRAR